MATGELTSCSFNQRYVAFHLKLLEGFDNMNPQPPPGFNPGELTSYAQAEEFVHSFEAVLKKHGIEIVRGSPLETICFTIYDVYNKHRNVASMDLRQDIRPMLRSATGFIDMMKRVLRLSNHPDFARLVPHMRLMNKGSVAQNVKAIGDEASNKLFESLMGLLCLEVGQNLEMDDPEKSTGKNPDVLATFESTRWGFACKVLNGQKFSPITMFDNLKKAVDQIQESPAQVGIPVLNFKNVIDHDEIWPVLNANEVKAGGEPIFAAWKHRDIPISILVNHADKWHREFEDVNTLPEVKKLFEGKRSTPAAFAYLQSTCALQTATKQPVPTILGIFVLMDFSGQKLLQTRPEYRLVLNKLNDAMHHRPA